MNRRTPVAAGFKMLLFLSVLAISLFPCPSKAEQPGEKIEWHDFNDQLFAAAKKEHKLVVLDLEAIWCHWCHVMDHETYAEPEVHQLFDKYVIAAKVDQDSRPDLANRYEDYGWPATIIFDENGKELDKISGFISKEDMIATITRLHEHPSTERVKTSISQYSGASALNAELKTELIAKHMKGYDTKSGAWSTFEKFLNADSEEYAILESQRGDAEERKRAIESLDKQQLLLDPAWGGMYQYSTNADWRHPHFEKIMAVQSDNIRMYSLGYLNFQKPKFLATANSVYSYLSNFLLSPEHDFYTSQDADLVQGVQASSYFRLEDADRRAKGLPRIDKHVYARENGMAIEALSWLFVAGDDDGVLEKAVSAADRICTTHGTENGAFHHSAQNKQNGDTSFYLADSLCMAKAMLALYATTADRHWLDKACKTASFMASEFRRETLEGLVTASAPGSQILQPTQLQDENIAAARFFNLLDHYRHDNEFRKTAQSCMKYLSTPVVARKRKIFVAGILLANDECNSEPAHIVIVGRKDDVAAKLLFRQTLKCPLAYRQVEWLDDREGPLSSDSSIEYPKLPKAAAFICAGNRCSSPIYEPDKLLVVLNKLGQKH